MKYTTLPLTPTERRQREAICDAMKRKRADVSKAYKAALARAMAPLENKLAALNRRIDERRRKLAGKLK